MEQIPTRYLEPAKNIWEELLSGKHPLDQLISQFFAAEKKYGKRDRRWISEPVFCRARNFLLINELQEEDQWPAAFLLANLTDDPGSLNQKITEIKRKSIRFRYSLSSFFYRSLYKHLTEADFAAIRRPGKACFRINTNKTNKEEIIIALQEAGIAGFQIIKECLILESRLSRENLLLKTGKLIPQDMGSQQVVPFMENSQSHNILDLCAGSGGKTLHLSAVTKNKGNIFAYDIANHRLNKLRPRMKITNSKNITLLKKLPEKPIFNRILIDAPCSGSGAIARHPEIAMRLEKDSLSNILKEQKQILDTATKLLKPGGIITYATCSLFPIENEEQILEFLSNNKEFKLQNANQILPSQYSGEGYFVCNIKHLLP